LSAPPFTSRFFHRATTTHRWKIPGNWSKTLPYNANRAFGDRVK
jgi:hypothetical protein